MIKSLMLILGVGMLIGSIHTFEGLWIAAIIAFLGGILIAMSRD